MVWLIGDSSNGGFELWRSEFKLNKVCIMESWAQLIATGRYFFRRILVGLVATAIRVTGVLNSIYDGKMFDSLIYI